MTHYTKTSYGTVIDHQTGLEWGLTQPKELTHSAAEKAVHKLDLGGSNGWRLPTIRELLSLVDYSRYSPATDTTWFPDTKSGWYWTSTPDAEAPAGSAWVVAFDYGYSGIGYRGNHAWVRPVRSVKEASS